jgi:multiple sugar transport system permease protein
MTRSREGSPRLKREAWTSYALILPAFAFVSIVILYPVVGSVWASLSRDGSFVGLSNFRAIFDDSVFWQSFRNNLILLVSVPLRIAIALVVTAILFRGIIGRRTYELVIFLPFIPSIAAIGVVFTYLLNAAGPFNNVLAALGMGSLSRGWLTNPDLTMWTIMGVVLWTRVGFTVLLLLARLLSVDRELFEASFVDGSSWWQTYRHVALPELRGTIEFLALLSFMEVFSWSFAYVYVLTQGGRRPMHYILELYLYQQEFLSYLPGLAAAVAVLLLAMALVLAIYRYTRVREEIT